MLGLELTQAMQVNSQLLERRIIRDFFVSVVVVLALTAAAKLYSATGPAKILSFKDPVLHLNFRALLILAGMLEVGVAGYLYRTIATGTEKALRGGARVVLWLGSNFACYRLGLYLTGVSFCPCAGTLGSSKNNFKF